MRLVPTAYHGWKSVRFDVIIEPTPSPKLASNNHLDKVDFSSFYHQENLKYYELNSGSCWAASDQTCNVPEKDYIQFNFKEPETIIGIDLQGRKGSNQWITKFKIMTSQNGTNFNYAFNGREFEGNTDNETVKSIEIPKIETRYLRFVPTGHNVWKSCRIGVKIFK